MHDFRWPALWLFASYVSGLWAVALGAVWIAARVWYATAYQQDAGRRGPRFSWPHPPSLRLRSTPRGAC